MFDLNQSITEWRRQMAAGGIKSPKVLDELESHLREDVERRIQSGAPLERAFQEATRQIGAAKDLKLEFGKISLPQPRLNRTTMRLGCAGMAVFVFLVEGWTLLAFDVARVDRILGMALVSLIAGYIGFLPDLNRLQPGVRGWALRKAIAMTCNCAVVLWTCLLLLSVWNIVPLPREIIFNIVCWSLYVAAAATGVVIALGTEPEALKLWTPEAWQSFEFAGVEASRFHHDFIGTEHVLLGVLQSENTCVRNILSQMGVSSETVRGEIEKIVGKGPESQSHRPPPYTPRALKAIKLAVLEAKALHSERVGAEHVFLGLIREGSGVAAKVLGSLGVNTTKARAGILKNIQPAAGH